MNKMFIYLRNEKSAPIATQEEGTEREAVGKKFAEWTKADSEVLYESIPLDAVPLTSVIQRIKYLASLDPTELARKMDTEEGASLAQVETEPVELNSLLRPWNAIRRASPEPLTGAQYDAFLKGEHPIADVDELYGAHLESES
jgi:hypothetical protein